MAKSIVLCSDGTGNAFDERPTNVSMLFLSASRVPRTQRGRMVRHGYPHLRAHTALPDTIAQPASHGMAHCADGSMQSRGGFAGRPMFDIFISYARPTAPKAQRIADALKALGYSVWIDDELPVHRAYGDVIQEHLRAAKAVVAVWSADAVQSEWMRSEANRGREERKLVQLSLDGTPLPMPFDQIQCADLSDWSGDLTAPAWKKVVASIRELAGDARAPAAPPVRKNSICVLPFVNMSGDVEQEYFSDGISEDIITDLSNVSALFVIARNTAFTFKGKTFDVSQVARQLGVSHVLEGSVRKAQGRVRITAQLIDGATGGHLWAERYDRTLDDIFELQDEISKAIVAALQLKLLPQEKQNIEQRRTTNTEAYDLYLRGRRPAFAPDEMRARIALLEAATRLAPDYADAWAALAVARSFWRLYRPYAERDEIADAVAVEANRALTLDPNNVIAVDAQYQLLPPFGRFIDAETLICRMEEIAPRDAYVLAARAAHLTFVGRNRDALGSAQRAHAIDPLDHFVSNMRGRALWHGGRHAEARRIFEELLARWPEQHWAATNLLILCAHTQDWAAVDSLLAPDRLEQYPLRENEEGLRWFVSVLRDPSAESRRRVIDRALQQFETFGTASVFLLQLAAQHGAADEAHDIASRACFGPTGHPSDEIGFDAYRPVLLLHSMFPEFRRDPRFVKLCARFGLVDYWLTTQQWPDCIDEVAPYYDFKTECANVAAGPPIAPAGETVRVRELR